MTTRKHRWKEAGRLPVQLVRRVCECGCKRQMIQIVTDDGRALGFQLPGLGAVASPDSLRTVQAGVSIGREALAFWERIKSMIP